MAARRAESLVRLAEALGELGRTREEMTRLQRSVEDERRETVLRGRFDALTGLPAGERLERALESALVSASEKSQVAVAVFDIEHLVKLNSRLGRPRANSVLQQVAQRLVAALRAEEMRRYAARLVRAMLARAPDGAYAFTDTLDDDGRGSTDLPITVTLRLRAGHITFDFAGTAQLAVVLAGAVTYLVTRGRTLSDRVTGTRVTYRGVRRRG